MALDLPLVLHHCDFDNLNIQYQAKALWSLSTQFKQTMEKHLIAYARAKNAYDFIQSKYVKIDDLKDLLLELDSKKQKSDSRLSGLLTKPKQKKDDIAFEVSKDIVVNSDFSYKEDFIVVSTGTKRSRESNDSENQNNIHENSLLKNDRKKEDKYQKLEELISDIVNSNTTSTILWSKALSILSSHFNYSPLENFSPHVPIRQVSVSLIYFT